MTKVQFIRTSKGGDLAILPRADYEVLVREAARHDAAKERRAAQRRTKKLRDDALPFDVVEAIVAGTSPLRAWRDYAGMTAAEVAAAAGISAGYLSQIETGKRAGTLRVLRAIAAALGIELADLTGESFA
ncbi:MAG: helix-turn-helix transcriptional regulator [Alphaproteobacteria bacterium]